MRQRHWNPSLSEIKKMANAMLRYYEGREPPERPDWVEGKRIAEHWVKVMEMKDLNKDAIDDLLHEIENSDHVDSGGTGFIEMYVWIKKLSERHK